MICDKCVTTDLIALIPGDLFAVCPGDGPAAGGALHGALEAVGAPPRGAGLSLVIYQLLLVTARDLRHG